MACHETKLLVTESPLVEHACFFPALEGGSSALGGVQCVYFTFKAFEHFLTLDL